MKFIQFQGDIFNAAHIEAVVLSYEDETTDVNVNIYTSRQEEPFFYEFGSVQEARQHIANLAMWLTKP